MLAIKFLRHLAIILLIAHKIKEKFMLLTLAQLKTNAYSFARRKFQASVNKEQSLSQLSPIFLKRVSQANVEHNNLSLEQGGAATDCARPLMTGRRCACVQPALIQCKSTCEALVLQIVRQDKYMEQNVLPHIV
ncbi:unnamed protein product [Arctia plantaginis]|uniref:Uncharacterized protein n=1 Tax=Arctia plantaginis TaxID=874455 RepID=A0A8S0YPF9_ARCPL|nr:unnamed protein product [Arctia plantaginis]